MVWVRKGDCNRCGDCCKTGDPFVGQLNITPRVDGACPLFKFNSDGLGTCMYRTGEIISDNILIKNYTENACSKWPQAPEQIEGFSNCSYTFEWVVD